MRRIFDHLCTKERDVSPSVLRSVLALSVELAREGREGHKIGTLLTISDEKNVLRLSRPLILDPLFGHPNSLKKIDNADMRETVKELAQLDGAFIITGDGVVVCAARYLEASAEGVTLPLGLGARHMAAAAMSFQTNTVAVVVSSSSTVRVFDDGEIVGEILPELWLIGQSSIYIPHPLIQESQEEKITVVSKKSKSKSETNK